jgi:putative serine protease PepD
MTSAPTDPAPRKVASTQIVAGAVAAIALVSGVAGGLIVHFASDDSGGGSGAAATRCAGVAIADKVLPSVVTIRIQSASGSSSGSGEFIRDNGYVLTNDHVISAAATSGRIEVVFSSGDSEQASLVGRATRLDLAVLKVDTKDKVPTISVGKSDALLVGQPVVALGAPLGLEGTVTSGIVSALGRDVPVPGDGQEALIPGAVQTDASINPGNSGGALVDCSGRLIGVNTAIATVPNAAGQPGGGSVGIGFAIPSDLAMVVADDLIANGRFSSPYLGLSTSPVPAAVAQRFDTTDGLFVQSVTAGGPAAAAGIRAGDVITKLNGDPTVDPSSLFVKTVRMKAGEKVQLDYEREGEKHSASLTLATQPRT